MNWNLENKTVKGMYLQQFAVSGIVTESRVKYGGGVTHYVTLDKPVEVFGRICNDVILKSIEITKVI